MIPLVVVKQDNRRAAQLAMEHQESGNEEYPGINTYGGPEGLEYFHYEELFWLERLMQALMKECIPFQVEYCDRIPDAFIGFQGNRVEF